MHFRALALIAILSFAPTAEAVAAEEIVVGVISPLDPGRAIGIAHEETIRFAFGRTDGTIRTDTVALPLRVEYRSDGGTPERAVEAARELVAAGAVAILGPVDSSSTQAVLHAHLEVPVISALSTATSLSKPRDPWFFRMTLSDDQRVRQYVATLHNHEELIKKPRLVVYDGASAYGTGLKDDLAKELAIPHEETLAWTKVSAKALAAHPALATIFVLGSSEGAVKIAHQIAALLRAQPGTQPARFLFVGDDNALRDGAPHGSITIGDPTIVDETGSEIAKLRAEYAKARKQDPKTLLVSAYEAAYYVLPAALRAVVAGLPAPNSAERDVSRSPVQLRAALREKLEKVEFESLEAWRHIRLRNGAITGAPPVPVYRVNPHLDLIEVPEPQPYLEVESPTNAGYLQGPVTMLVRAHRTERVPELNIYRDTGGALEPVESNRVDRGDVTEVSFYPKWPGAYLLKANANCPMKPAQPKAVVGLSPSYLIALLGALAGSFLFALAGTERGQRFPKRRIALGVVTGCAIAVLDFHRSLLPGGAAFPSFASSPNLAAFWDGLAGGWVGPGIFVLLLGRFLPGSGAFGPGTDAKQKPQAAAHAGPSPDPH